ncbi:hypothetical protein QQ045_022161 [Rhodiola kirilowii]
MASSIAASGGGRQECHEIEGEGWKLSSTLIPADVQCLTDCSRQLKFGTIGLNTTHLPPNSVHRD